jgi:hypothetical protein
LLLDFTIGPRREVALEIALDPFWNKGDGRTVRVHLGAVDNLDEVAAYFYGLRKPVQPGGAIAGVIGLAYVGDRKDAVVVDLERCGSVTIQSRRVNTI